MNCFKFCIKNIKIIVKIVGYRLMIYYNSYQISNGKHPRRRISITHQKPAKETSWVELQKRRHIFLTVRRQALALLSEWFLGLLGDRSFVLQQLLPSSFPKPQNKLSVFPDKHGRVHFLSVADNVHIFGAALHLQGEKYRRVQPSFNSYRGSDRCHFSALAPHCYLAGLGIHFFPHFYLTLEGVLWTLGFSAQWAFGYQCFYLRWSPLYGYQCWCCAQFLLDLAWRILPLILFYWLYLWHYQKCLSSISHSYIYIVYFSQFWHL